MIQKSDLAQLMAQIAKEFPFIQEKYPKLDFSTPERARASATDHSLTHIIKTAGRIATQVERDHHGGPVNLQTLREETASMVIHALNLANALDITADELRELIRDVMR